MSHRCPSCAKCVKCKKSLRTRAMIIKETMEQDTIEKSVFIDYIKAAVFVDLPFLEDLFRFVSMSQKSVQLFLCIHCTPTAMQEASSSEGKDEGSPCRFSI